MGLKLLATGLIFRLMVADELNYCFQRIYETNSLDFNLSLVCTLTKMLQLLRGRGVLCHRPYGGLPFLDPL